MTTPLSIDAYKRKQNVLAAKAHARRISATPNQPRPRSKEAYTAQQRRYLNACVEKHADPDARLLMALREARFMLKLDRFGEGELRFHVDYLQKTKHCNHISLSLGSVAINRDLRTKFDRLGLKRAYAYENQGASAVVRSACSSAYKTPDLLRFHLIGVKILPEVVPLLSKSFFHCQHLEDVSLNGTNLGDEGLEAIAMALGKCPKLHLLSLARCNLTDNARDHIAKIITLHGVIKDESVWSSSLRGEVAPSGASMPELLINLSCNKLGDVTAETICDALYNDKWLLGLNLGENKISQQGAEMFIDTFTNNNKTLAVLGLANMKEPVATSTLDVLDSLLRVRNRFLQQVATESREKRMALGSLLLDWGVDKDTIVEICYLETLGKKIAKDDNGGRSSTSNNNNNQGDSENGDSDVGDDEVATSAADSHVKTIEYLIERLSALESEKRKTQAYVSKLESDNIQLRAELDARDASAPSPGISPIEAQIIAQLETSISSLAEQVEIMEHENSTATMTEQCNSKSPAAQ
ncbi:LRR-containing protein [Phytophthora cinnamomi]|uniref:LRR-containing protein n=1 Tax=Phytophthora cinnamomi TaxID=4785 RepID=UPI003559588E|nr:LRR-containing protein [Phytophthora cinnamomi]